jgi:hypothetical protein
MNAGVSNLALLLISGAALSAAALYGLAALWAVGGRGGWLVRWTPLTLLLAALAPIGAYELLALYGMQATLITGVLWLVSVVKRRRAAPNGQPPRFAWPQFSLRDVLKVFLLVGAALAIIRDTPPDASAAIGRTEWWPWASAGVGLGAVTLIAAWTAFGRAPWYARVVVFVVFTVTAGAILTVLGNFVYAVYVYASLGVTITPAHAFLFSAGFDGLPMLICLALIRRSGWAGRHGRQVDDEPVSPTDIASTVHVRGRLSAQAGLSAIAVLGVCLLGPMYWALLPPAKPKPEPLPSPNGYDLLVRAAGAINFVSVPGQDFDEVPLSASQTFVQANVAPLALARQAISMPFRCPVVYDDTFNAAALPDIQAARTLARAMRIEAQVAAVEGRAGDAVRIDRDIVRLGCQFSRGGLLIHELVGSAIEGVGVAGLIEQLHSLDANDLAALGHDLATTNDDREPVDKIVANDRLFALVSRGWQGRLDQWYNDLVLGRDAFHEMVLKVRARDAALLRLILAEAAIRRYVLAEGSPPESLAVLVPKYLSAVPQDPFGDGPLVYRRTADGYLLYSVGANGTDDGGQRVSRDEATELRKGDLFFDASPDIPEEEASPEAATDE